MSSLRGQVGLVAALAVPAVILGQRSGVTASTSTTAPSAGRLAGTRATQRHRGEGRRRKATGDRDSR
jgi:hypothetical protein